MKIKIDASYFELKAKPSLLHSLALNTNQNLNQLKSGSLSWDFRSLNEFSNINNTLISIKSRSKQLITKIDKIQERSTEGIKCTQLQVVELLQEAKNLVQKCEFFNITLSSCDILSDESGLLHFYKYPDTFKTCALLTEIQRSLKGIEMNKDVIQIEKKFPWIGILQKTTANQVLSVLKSLKDNIYIPSGEFFTQLLQKLHFKYEDTLSLKQNFIRNSYNLNDCQSFTIYYQLLIYKECSTLQGLGHFLSYTKNILLDKKSGALAAQHETWVAIFEACLKLYARNPQLRVNNLLQIDQILSTTVMDEQFTNFLLSSRLEDFSLASFNFYIKNINKADQSKLLEVAENKIFWLFESGNGWKEAEDIVEHLDNECQGETKQKIYNRIIKLIDSIFLSDETSSKSSSELIEIQIGLSFFIESMCKHLQVSEKIFNKTNLDLIISTLKNSQNNQTRIRLLYHVFTQFIINSYQQSDQLSSYLEKNQQLVTQKLPEIITLFKTYNYTLPKELYKLIFHLVKDIDLLDSKIWRGIAELYFIQCFEQSIDLEIFHTQNQAKQRIADHVVQILKELTMSNAKQHILIAEALKFNESDRGQLQNFLQLKAFKDQLIFNNCLMISTFFGEHLLLAELSGVLSEFYTPIIPDIKWKSAEHQSLTLMSYIAEQLPIDILKATYKFLKQGFTINIKSLEGLSTTFWNTYFSNEPQSKVRAIVKESQFSFDAYQTLQSLRMLDLILNMINCVFDKLNEHSQKSIKELKIMYEWGIEYIKELQPQLYPILLDCLVNKLQNYEKQLDNESVQTFELYDKKKNISILDMHMYDKYHIFQTFNDFNKIGHVIGHEKAPQVSLLVYPCFSRQSKYEPKCTQKVSDERSLLKTVFKLILLIENSCLEEVMNYGVLSKVSKLHVQHQRYYKKVIPLINQIKQFLPIATQNNFSSVFKQFIQKPLYKRLISHLKLLMGKIYIPFIIKQAFIQKNSESSQNFSKKLKNLDQKFVVVKSLVEVIHNFNPAFEQHFAEVMQIIEENSQKQEKKASTQVNDKASVCPQILIKTLEMFFKCVMSNIKVRSFHIFKLIKLYLTETKSQVQPINQVIKFYIDMLYGEFIQLRQGHDFNEEVREKSCPFNNVVSQSKKNNNECSRVKILTPNKNKESLSFMDKILSPLRKEKISLQELKLKKMQKSRLTPQKEKQNNNSKSLQVENYGPSCNSFDQSSFSYEQELPQQIKKLIIREHSLTTVQSSCTLSMFINLFARLNYSSLPTGVQHLLSKQNDKLVYLEYLIVLTQRLLQKNQSASISQRDLEILSIDVYGNLSCILKGKLNEQIFQKFIQLAKMTLKLQLSDENIVTLPIKLLNQRLFAKTQRRLSQQTNFNEFAHISKLIAEFQEEPLAYELSIKSHIMKISPFIKSNLHICNLEYIVGESKSSISKKIIQTNYKLLENIMGRTNAREYLKKYKKNNLSKEPLTLSISHQAINELDKILHKFTSLYSNIDISSDTQTIQLYFYFKKICSLLFYAPELFSYILGKTLTVKSDQMTFIDVVFDTLKYTLVFFCEFYITCLKTNSGFCTKQELAQVIKSTQSSVQKSLLQKTQKLPVRVPLNFAIEIYIKLRLLNKVKEQNEQNLNQLRVMNFAIKQSQKFRFRFYKFIKINVPESEQFLKKLDEQIMQSLLKEIQQPQSPAQESKEQNFINKVQLMDLCLQNLLSHTMFDYAKMRLDEKLKDTFINSQYSIKCLQSFNCDIKTLKVLEQAQEEKSISSGCEMNDMEDIQNDVISETFSQKQLEKEDGEDMDIQKEDEEKVEIQKKDVFQNLEHVKNIFHQQLIPQINRAQIHLDTLSYIEFTSQLQPFSVKQTSELKQWVKLTVFEGLQNSFTLTLIKEMQKSCQKMMGKQNFSFNSFEDPVYLQPSYNSNHIDIASFGINDATITSQDCCIDQSSLCEQNYEGMIVEQQNYPSTQNVQQQLVSEPVYDGICESEVNCDGIIQKEEEDGVQEIAEDFQTDMMIEISVVEETQVNRFKNYETEDGDAIVEMEDASQEDLQEQERVQGGTDGSIEFTSSIRTLENVDEIQMQQVSQELSQFPYEISQVSQELPQFPQQSTTPAQQSPSIFTNNHRQYHYTIDYLTVEPSQSRLNLPNSNHENSLFVDNSSLVDTISAEIVDQPITKESIFNLIQQYTLNPEVLKLIKLKLKKISNSQLKKVHPLTHAELKDEVEKQMRSRGLYVALAPGQYESPNEGSLFSISRLINQTFQIDQSKFYSANYKKCDKKTFEKQKIDKIPQLSFNQWVNFVFLYLLKAKQTQLKNNNLTETPLEGKQTLLKRIQTLLEGNQTLLEGKQLGQLLIKLLLHKENLVKFLEVLLNLLSCENVQQTVQFFQNYMKLPSRISDQQQIFESIPGMIVNKLIAKLIKNRIGLAVLFKGKWNYETKRLIKYEFQCLISDSNLNNNYSQGQPLLEVFIRKSIELIYVQQSIDKDNNKQPVQLQTFVKSLSEYFKSMENFQSNDYPYYSIQDTIKLTCPHKKTVHNENNLWSNYQPKPQYSLGSNFNRSKISLCETLLNTMKASSLDSIKLYQEVFQLMNYLDFQTFSDFLSLLVQRHKPLCEKLIDKQINILKRFKKSVFTQNLNQQKLPQIYWHMRRSSKSFLSTDHQQKQLQFFAKILSLFSSTIFHHFKESIFKFGYGKEENKKKQKITHLNKLLVNPAYEHKFNSIRQEIAQNQKDLLLWRLAKSTQILKEDLLPIIQKIAASYNDCLKKWQILFEELEDLFGTEREEKFILYKQCSEFYKIFLSLEMLLQSEETSTIRTMSSLKTKPSLQSTREMGVTGRRRSSLKLPRASSLQLNLSPMSLPATFKQVFKRISPKFSFFSQMIEQTCAQLKIHAKYSTIESKLKFLHQKNNNGQVTIQVRRNYIWQDTLPFLNEQIADKNVKIKIAEELGLDYGGIRREWITLLVKELFNPNLGLFQLSANGLAFQPSALSYLVPNHLYYFYKLGILVGKALKQNWLLQINFTKSFLKHILAYTLYVQDLQDIDPDTTKSLLWILNNDVGNGDLGIDFTHTYEVLGKKVTIQLIENGKDILVTEQNKKDYVKLLAVHKMTSPIREQSKAFMNGLQKVIHFQTLKIFSYKQLAIYLAGMPTVDVQQMKKHTRYQGFSDQDQSVKWFWETLSTYTQQEKANFLFFLTGSYKVPYGGFKENPISINKMPASIDYLPVSHTCFSVIDLPEYSSKDKLALLLDKAIKEGKGFSVS